MDGSGNRLLMDARDPNGLWCIEMAEVPNERIGGVSGDDIMNENGDLSTNDFYLTADFDQNLTLV